MEPYHFQTILQKYWGKNLPNSGSFAEVMVEELLEHFDARVPRQGCKSFPRKFSDNISVTREESRQNKWRLIAELSQEIELCKRLVRKASQYKKLTEVIGQCLEDPQSRDTWVQCEGEIWAFHEELRDLFYSETVQENKMALKSYIDACRISLAIIEGIEQGQIVKPYLEVLLSQESYAAYADKYYVYLYDAQNLERTFGDHLEKIREKSREWEKESPSSGSVSRIKQVQMELRRQLRASEGGWKSRIYGFTENRCKICKQYKMTIASHLCEFSRAIKEEERFRNDFLLEDYEGGCLAAGFCGSTFSGPQTSHFDKNFILDASYLMVNRREISFSGGDGYEHPSSLKRQEQVCRATYFGNKHLVRLASTFQRPNALYKELFSLFREAAREAALKSHSTERFSTTLIQAFRGDNETMKVVVASVGDALAFAYTPEEEIVTLLACPRQYANGLGGFSPISCVDSDFLPSQIEQNIFDIPLGSLIFYMTDGVWETLDCSTREKEGCRCFIPDESRLISFLKGDDDSLRTPLAYKEAFKKRCVNQMEEERQKLIAMKEEERSVSCIGDDATMVVFQLCSLSEETGKWTFPMRSVEGIESTEERNLWKHRFCVIGDLKVPQIRRFKKGSYS